MDRSKLCRSALRALLTCCCALFSTPAYVMMAGAPPDSPAARVDANTTSSLWTGVGSVVVGGASYSGVLIAPEFVLTAAHVAGYAAPGSVQVVFNVGGDQTHVLQAQAIERYPSASFPYDDLTLVRLATPAPPGIRRYPLWREAVAVGQRITLVGYGASGNGTTGVSIGGSRTVKRAGENIVDVIQTSIDASGRSSLFYLFDFDGPTGNGGLGGPTLGNAIETQLAGGDSGSPAFIVGTGGPWLVGINTFVASGNGTDPSDRFGAVGGGMLLPRPAFLEWIDTTTGYTTVASALDIPMLPQWAVIIGMGAMAFSAIRGGRRIDRTLQQ